MEFTKMWDTITNNINYTQTELELMAIFSVIGGAISFLLGGFDPPIICLLVLIIADFITGLMAGWYTSTLGSRRGFRGLFKKIVIVTMIAFANMIDISMGLGHLLRGMAIFGYAGMEGLSIIENIDRMGYGDCIPSFIRSKLVQLRDEKGFN